jgi:hypothetical protein
VRWRKRGFWFSIGVGRRIWIWIGGRRGVVVVVVVGGVVGGDVDEDGDEDDGVDIVFFLFLGGFEWVRCCRLDLGMAMAVYVCMRM